MEDINETLKMSVKRRDSGPLIQYYGTSIFGDCLLELADKEDALFRSIFKEELDKGCAELSSLICFIITMKIMTETLPKSVLEGHLDVSAADETRRTVNTHELRNLLPAPLLNNIQLHAVKVLMSTLKRNFSGKEN